MTPADHNWTEQLRAYLEWADRTDRFFNCVLGGLCGLIIMLALEPAIVAFCTRFPA